MILYEGKRKGLVVVHQTLSQQAALKAVARNKTTAKTSRNRPKLHRGGFFIYACQCTSATLLETCQTVTSTKVPETHSLTAKPFKVYSMSP